MNDNIPTAVSRYLNRNRLDSTDIRAALIDMDGTLYDSMPGHVAAWHRMITGLGIDSDPDEYYLYEGMTGAATINLIFNRAYGRDATPAETENLYHLKTVYFNSLPTAPQMPGAARMLRTLEQEGIRRVLVTGSGQASLIDRLNSDFPGAFAPADMITSRSVTRGKPHPEPYLKGLEIAGVKPTQAIVIENAPLGVESGHRAGAFTVGITTGPIPAGKLTQAGADIVFPSMEAFADSLTALLNELKHPSI